MGNWWCVQSSFSDNRATALLAISNWIWQNLLLWHEDFIIQHEELSKPQLPLSNSMRIEIFARNVHRFRCSSSKEALNIFKNPRNKRISASEIVINRSPLNDACVHFSHLIADTNTKAISLWIFYFFYFDRVIHCSIFAQLWKINEVFIIEKLRRLSCRNRMVVHLDFCTIFLSEK